MPSYKLTDLRKALMVYKKEKKYTGTPSKMKKAEIMDALKGLNFDFSSLSSEGKNPITYDKASGGYKKKEAKPPVGAGMVFDKATGTYVKGGKASAPKKGRMAVSTPPPPRSSAPAGRGRGRPRKVPTPAGVAAPVAGAAPASLGRRRRFFSSAAVAPVRRPSTRVIGEIPAPLIARLRNRPASIPKLPSRAASAVLRADSMGV